MRPGRPAILPTWAVVSEACGKPKGWLKSATATDREIKTLEPEVER
jgi:hypothetical protein